VNARACAQESPVKGVAGVSAASAEVTETGLAHDRTFMVVDEADGPFRSQRDPTPTPRTASAT
jgi:uncharacterized protein YcbX